MKYIKEIENLVVQKEIVKKDLAIARNSYLIKDESSDKIILICLKVSGLASFIIISNYYEWEWKGMVLSLVYTIFTVPIILPIGWMIRSLSEVIKKKFRGEASRFETKAELKKRIYSLQTKNHKIDNRLNEKLVVQIERIRELINHKYKTYPSRLLNHYIHSQYLQIVQVIQTLDGIYGFNDVKYYNPEYSITRSAYENLSLIFKLTFYMSSFRG